MNTSEKLNRNHGFGLISLIIMLAMVGFIFWLMNKSLSRTFSPTGESSSDSGSPAQGILAPINAAKDAKNLIESRYQAEP
ncbi:MAG: hypothetical protein AAB455_02060 [Patescibacteria group bacterium]